MSTVAAPFALDHAFIHWAGGLAARISRHTVTRRRRSRQLEACLATLDERTLEHTGLGPIAKNGRLILVARDLLLHHFRTDWSRSQLPEPRHSRPRSDPYRKPS